MTPLSFAVGLAESAPSLWSVAPSLWSVAPSLWSVAPSLWSVAGSIPVTTINKTITNSCTIYKPVLMFLSIVDSVVAPSPWPAVTAVPPDREWSQYHGLGYAATTAWWYSLVTNLLLLSGHLLLLSGHSLLLSGHSLLLSGRLFLLSGQLLLLSGQLLVLFQ